MSRLSRFLPATLLTLAAPAAARFDSAALHEANPAVWMVQDKDTTIYLFGTVHVMDDQTRWFDDEVKDSFDRADELVIEMVWPDDPAAITAAVQHFALSPDHKPLREKMAPAKRAKLEAMLKTYGEPLDSLDAMRPSFAALRLTQLQFAKQGLKSDRGIEQVLTDAAKTAHKPVRGVETLDYQLRLMAEQPDALQMEMLYAAVDDEAKADAQLARLTRAWKRGDEKALSKEIDQDPEIAGEVGQRILRDRNAHWAGWVAQRMKSPGTVFMAVGAAHLAGKSSLLNMLRQRSIPVLRIDGNTGAARHAR